MPHVTGVMTKATKCACQQVFDDNERCWSMLFEGCINELWWVCYRECPWDSYNEVSKRGIGWDIHYVGKNIMTRPAHALPTRHSLLSCATL